MRAAAGCWLLVKPLSIGHIHTEAAALAFSDVARPKKVATTLPKTVVKTKPCGLLYSLSTTHLYIDTALGRSTLNQMSMRTSSVDEPKRIVQQA